jgi:DNA-binding LytR/AlgR family response regulator
MSLRCITLDSDAPALAEISYLLEQDNRVSMVTRTREYEDLHKTLQADRYDAVFVCLIHHDPTKVKEMLDQISAHTNFVALSRFPDHAFSAYEVGATDFILKPVNRANLDRALNRLLNATISKDDTTRLKVERRGSVHYIDIREILHIEANGDYTHISTLRGVFTSRQSLSQLAQELAKEGFFRIHRKWLVPLARIQSIQTDCGNRVALVHDREIPVSRALARELRNILG